MSHLLQLSRLTLPSVQFFEDEKPDCRWIETAIRKLSSTSLQALDLELLIDTEDISNLSKYDWRALQDALTQKQFESLQRVTFYINIGEDLEQEQESLQAEFRKLLPKLSKRKLLSFVFQRYDDLDTHSENSDVESDHSAQGLVEWVV